jgi:hypothetical protein
MNEYQMEQYAALGIVRDGLIRMGASSRRQLRDRIDDYLVFRKTVDRFLLDHFSTICNQTCFTSRTSACCSKDGIITFFADSVVNALTATPQGLDELERVLKQPNDGHRCVYLGSDGCLWTVRPVVCAMFLCDRAMDSVFAQTPQARSTWDHLVNEARRFKWPDRPVLFDHLERVFIDLGYRSSLMHLNFSPGLLNVKKKAGLPTGG